MTTVSLGHDKVFFKSLLVFGFQLFISFVIGFIALVNNLNFPLLTLLDLGRDSLKAIKLRFVCFYPAALVPDDVLVGKLGDCLDFFHRWVLKDRFFTIRIELGM